MGNIDTIFGLYFYDHWAIALIYEFNVPVYVRHLLDLW